MKRSAQFTKLFNLLKAYWTDFRVGGGGRVANANALSVGKLEGSVDMFPWENLTFRSSAMARNVSNTANGNAIF